jgi:superfamily II DNA or RNA helicase
MDLINLYKINIYEKWNCIEKQYKKTNDNILISKIFEWYVCIKLSEKYNKIFYEYSYIDPDFREKQQMTQTDTGIDCCDLNDTIVQCKLRKDNLTWKECSTFFGSQNIYDYDKNEIVIRWNKLFIARNENSKLSNNLLSKSRLFTDVTYSIEELLEFCEKLKETKPKYPKINNETIILRDYQLECIDKIKKMDRNLIINLPTGAGKNLILIKSLNKNKKYLILVPRIILMEQIEKNILEYAPELQKNVQCIGNGNNNYDKTKKITICVYNSISIINKFETFFKIFIDEAHHIKNPLIYKNDELTNYDEDIGNNDDKEIENNDNINLKDDNNDDEIYDNEKYINFINSLGKYNNNIYLSATIDKNNNYDYYGKDIRDMIDKGYLCDYTINIPIFKNKNNINVCWYLIKKYSHIIIYCSNCQDGKKINELLNLLVPNCSNYIDCYTKKNERNNIIKNYKSGKISYLVNVKTLVEGFDAPITQGVCFMHLPISKTSIIQIIGRALRLHPNKKIANIILPYITSDDEFMISKFMKIIAQNDSRITKSFLEKKTGGYININIVNDNFNNNSNNNLNNDLNNNITDEVYELIYDKLGNLTNMEEIWKYKHNLLIKFIEKFDKIPTKSQIFENVKIGMWFRNQKNYIFSNKDSLYFKLGTNDIIKHNIDNYLKKKEINKIIPVLTFEDKYKIFMDFVNENNRTPMQKENYKNIGLGQWYQEQKKKIKSIDDEMYKILSTNNLVKKNLDELLNYKEKNVNKKKLSFDESLKLFLEFVEKKKRTPTESEKDLNGNSNLGKWLQHQKLKIINNESEIYKKISVNEIAKKKLDEYLLNKEQNN